MYMAQLRRDFQKGTKGTTVYIVNGTRLDRLDLIFHILCWARDNKQMDYPKENFQRFISYIIEQGYKRNEDVCLEEAEAIARLCEETFFHKNMFLSNTTFENTKILK